MERDEGIRSENEQLPFQLPILYVLLLPEQSDERQDRLKPYPGEVTQHRDTLGASHGGGVVEATAGVFQVEVEDLIGHPLFILKQEQSCQKCGKY